MSTLCTEAVTSTSINAKLAKIFKATKQYLTTRYNQRVDRQAFQNVLKLDDHTLRDIGVTRADVKWASRLPLSEDAATRLEIIARRR